MATCVFFLVTFLVFADSYRQPIKVFEITKTRHPDSRIDAQYYDPELEKTNRNNRNNLNNVVYIIKSLQTENDDNYKYSDEETVLIDDTRTLPVIILPEVQTVYHEKPRNYKILHKLLHSALRSNGAEDRTAPPRHLRHYDKENYY